MEADDYRDYEKALAALSEAYHVLCKSPAAKDTYKAAIARLDARMTLIKTYLDAVRYVVDYIAYAVSVCRSTLIKTDPANKILLQFCTRKLQKRCNVHSIHSTSGY